MSRVKIIYSRCGCATVMQGSFIYSQETCERCCAGVMELIAAALGREEKRQADLFTPESGSDQRPPS